ncbi:MAG TPA: hypothetical protein VMU47_16975 [Caldimonas sp.]|nr:hypothetical protein [Caldimonas sp.]
MIVLYQRAPRADAAWWPGRHPLAALDALFWPAAWIGVALAAPVREGFVTWVVIAYALFSGATRLHTAIAHNERFRFTTWTCGRAIVLLVGIGVLMKLALVLAGV